MRAFTQTVCVLAIAMGGGLLAFGNKYQPRLDPNDPSSFARVAISYEDRGQHAAASYAEGVGTGLMLFGVLGLVIPWVRRWGSAMTGELGDNAARTIAIVSIWLSVAVVLTFGVFRISWTGTVGLVVVPFIVALICTAATASSAIVYGWRPWVPAIPQVRATEGPKTA